MQARETIADDYVETNEKFSAIKFPFWAIKILSLVKNFFVHEHHRIIRLKSNLETFLIEIPVCAAVILSSKIVSSCLAK